MSYDCFGAEQIAACYIAKRPDWNEITPILVLLEDGNKLLKKTLEEPSDSNQEIVQSKASQCLRQM